MRDLIPKTDFACKEYERAFKNDAQFNLETDFGDGSKIEIRQTKKKHRTPKF